MDNVEVDNKVTARQLGQLRARIEATFSGPTIIVVTSAMRGDGKTFTSVSLAESLSAADRRVLLIDANVEAPSLPNFVRLGQFASPKEFAKISQFARPVAGQRFLGVSLADERIEAEMSIDNVNAAAADIRANFDIAIIDASPATRSELAVLFASIADGTLLTLRYGRRPAVADDATIKTLSRVGATMLGVVTISHDLIKGFASRHFDIVKHRVVPVGHVSSHHTLERGSNREVSETAASSAKI